MGTRSVSPLNSADVETSIELGTKDMPEPFPRSIRPPTTRRQHQPQTPQVQQQQQVRHTHGQSTPQLQLQQPFHPVHSPLSDSGYHYPPSLPGSSSYGHTQPQPQSITQHPPSFIGHYAQPPPSIYTSQPQFPYAHAPQIPHHGIHPLPHTDFYQVSPTQPPVYVHPGASQEHSPSPTLTYDYEGNNSRRSPTSGASSPFTPSQPFSFGYHAALPSAPQYSSFSAFPTHQHQHIPRTQFTPSYAYMAASSPTSPEDSPSSTARWWYMPHPSAPSPVASYPGMFYVDAYNNQSSAGPGIGQTIITPPSVSPIRATTSPIYTTQEVTGGYLSRGGTETVQSPLVGNVHQEATSLTQQTASPTSYNLGESVSEHGQRSGSSKQSSQSQVQKHSHLSARSEWVMWIGNVPGDATHDELWRFFTRPDRAGVILPLENRSQHPPSLLPSGLLSSSGSSSTSGAGTPDTSGVQSVFLIARSNCAFVNYSSSERLQQAVARFNGVQLRPGDPRCPRLVCRVRGKEEDMRAGVGGQRGMGMHTRWVKEQREKELERQRNRLSGSETSLETPQTPSEASVDTHGSISSARAESARSPPQHSSSSGSTSSSFLSRYFPKRYFILKSLSQVCQICITYFI